IVVYPRNESDVRKVARFSWQLAERKRVLPITARGGGSDTSGAAIGSGIMLVFTAHMNRILSLDPRKEFVTLEPGVTYDKLEQTLYTHGLFLPPCPASKQFATIGGGLANNALGEKSVKYGATAQYVEQLRVVLANGEVIETGPLSKRQLNRKLGLSSLEGQIYRGIDKLLEENADFIKREQEQIKARWNAIGYNIFDVKKKGNFNLTPLILGSQGSLGIITEATLEVVGYNPRTTLLLASLNDLDSLNDVLPKILALKPSSLEMINQAAISQVTAINPHQLSGLMQNPGAAIHLFIEFDNLKEGAQKAGAKKARKITEQAGGVTQLANTAPEQEKLWKIRHSVATILSEPQGHAKAIPITEDICVPVQSLADFLQKAEAIYRQNDLVASAWGHAGDGIVRMQPVLDLAQLGDRQKLFRLTDDIANLVISLGGTLSASAGDGRVRAPYAGKQYSDGLLKLMLEVKKIFDPHGILNPGVKTASMEDVRTLLRGDYNLNHRHEHLPRS
ncbi:MAG TPA: FAD-binding oxidoreductase, partial [Candidatus Nitrosopolaris sp.]|nr:FAD-binding oxidoreductase [Candidatus Nitrosopolaris sp.]